MKGLEKQGYKVNEVKNEATQKQNNFNDCISSHWNQVASSIEANKGRRDRETRKGPELSCSVNYDTQFGKVRSKKKFDNFTKIGEHNWMRAKTLNNI